MISAFLRRLRAWWFGRRRPGSTPRPRLIRDANGTVVAWWRELTEAEMAEDPRPPRARQKRWIDRGPRPRW
jgi:hypothetical protein